MKKSFRVLFSCLLFLTTLGILLSNKLMYIKKKDEELIFKREKKSGRFSPKDFDTLPKREAFISSPFGYLLKAIVVEPHSNSNRYVIISHGVTENKINSIKYMNLFLKRGFNVLIYDHRRHGESGGKTTSYGHYEKFDLKAVVDWLKKDKNDDLLLGIHGESMGAVTVLLYAGMLVDGADFYVVDCPFSDFKEQLRYRLKIEMKLPAWPLLSIANLFLRLREKYSIQDVSPIAVIQNIRHPVLFIHSKKDDYILPRMTKELFEKKKGPKMLYLSTHGLHAQSLNKNRMEYENAIDEFIEKFVNIKIVDNGGRF